MPWAKFKEDFDGETTPRPLWRVMLANAASVIAWADVTVQQGQGQGRRTAEAPTKDRMLLPVTMTIDGWERICTGLCDYKVLTLAQKKDPQLAKDLSETWFEEYKAKGVQVREG